VKAGLLRLQQLQALLESGEAQIYGIKAPIYRVLEPIKPLLAMTSGGTP